MAINIGISEKNRQQVGHFLNSLLAHEYVLYTKTLKFHWNVEGKLFHPLHLFFESQYEQMLDIVDDVAERARALGIKAAGTLAEFLEHSTLKEQPGKNPNDLGMIEQLTIDHEIIIKYIRDHVEKVLEFGDAGTNNFLAELIEKHEKMAWMLRAHLTK